MLSMSALRTEDLKTFLRSNATCNTALLGVPTLVTVGDVQHLKGMLAVSLLRSRCQHFLVYCVCLVGCLLVSKLAE